VENKKMSSSYSVLTYAGIHLPPQYRNLVFSRWLRSLRFGNDYFKLIDSDAYYENYHIYLNNLLIRKNVTVQLAVLSDDIDVVLGFSVSENNTLHYVHIHKDSRKRGIGRTLIPAQIDTITHITKIGMSIWGSKFPLVKLNPFV
jgi:hypothetical protein